MTVILKLLGLILLIPLVIVLSAIINGCVLSTLWSWFIVPVFGLAALSIPEAIGISMVVSFLTSKHEVDNRSKGEEEKAADSIERWSYVIFYPILVLLIGYIVKGFM